MKTLNFKAMTAFTIIMAGMIPGIVMAVETPESTQEISSQNPAPQQIEVPQQMTLQKAKTMLLDMLDRLDAHYENTRTKMATLQKLTETSGIDISQVIQGYCDQIQVLKNRAQKAQNSLELKAVALDVHSMIVESKIDVQQNISKRIENRITQFTQKAEKTKPLFDQAKNRIEKLKAAGADSESVDEDYRECANMMSQGNQTLQQAKDKLLQFQELTREQKKQNARLMSDGMKMVKDARTAYGQARQNCSRVMRELRVIR